MAGGILYPVNPYNLEWREDRDQTLMRMFTQFHEATSLGGLQTNGIDLKKFTDGWTFFVLNLSPTNDDCNGFELVQNGTTSLRLQFHEPLPEAVTMLTLAEFDGVTYIDRNRTIVTDSTI